LTAALFPDLSSVAVRVVGLTTSTATWFLGLSSIGAERAELMTSTVTWHPVLTRRPGANPAVTWSCGVILVVSRRRALTSGPA